MNKEFKDNEIIEIVEKLIGDISWKGETYADTDNMKNRQKMFEVGIELIENSINMADIASDRPEFSWHSFGNQDIKNLERLKILIENYSVVNQNEKI